LKRLLHPFVQTFLPSSNLILGHASLNLGRVLTGPLSQEQHATSSLAKHVLQKADDTSNMDCQGQLQTNPFTQAFGGGSISHGRLA
jgi:hypothetical protein